MVAHHDRRDGVDISTADLALPGRKTGGNRAYFRCDAAHRPPTVAIKPNLSVTKQKQYKI